MIMNCGRRLASGAAMIVALAAIAALVMHFYPRPAGDAIPVMERQLLHDTRDVPLSAQQVHDLIAGDIIRFSDLAATIHTDRNILPIDSFLNELSMFDFAAGPDQQNLILTKMRKDMRRFLYLGNVGAIDLWNNTRGR